MCLCAGTLVPDLCVASSGWVILLPGSVCLHQCLSHVGTHAAHQYTGNNQHAPAALIPRHEPCPWDTGYEPTSMRAIRARYHPYVQARARVDQLRRLGHTVDKVIACLPCLTAGEASTAAGPAQICRDSPMQWGALVVTVPSCLASSTVPSRSFRRPGLRMATSGGDGPPKCMGAAW